MKRKGNLNHLIADPQNVEFADSNARKGTKSKQEVIEHDKNRKEENLKIAKDLESGSYKTSTYTTFIIKEPKERLIFKLPYYPDRIAHHAIMRILKPIWINKFIHQTYSSIEGRGIHMLKRELYKALKDNYFETQYCLKLDVHKFYPSLDHVILKNIIRKSIKDKQTLEILDEMIDSTDSLTPGVGVPIGNYLSQYFANIYLSEFDHMVKEVWKCKYYYRYADDIVILSDSKEWLHDILGKVQEYFKQIKLELKPNYQIFPVDSRGIDFVGYVFRHDYVLLRKSIKKNLKKLVNKYVNGKITKASFIKSLMSYKGWLIHCDSRHLAETIYEKTGFKLYIWDGKEVGISKFYNKYIWIVHLFKHKKYFEIYFKYRGKKYITKSSNWTLYNNIKQRKRPFYFNYHRKTHDSTE